MSVRPGRETALALCIVALGFGLRAGYALVVPPWQAPDERAHASYVRHVVSEASLPVQQVATPAEALRQWPQSYQPPLAYLSFAPLAAALERAGARYVTQLRALRLQNALYGALLVWLGFAVARHLAPPGDPLRLGAPLLVACLPGLVANAASVNNDALACLLVSATWLVWLRPGRDVARAAQVGALLGAAGLAKLTALTQAPLLWLAPMLLRGRAPGAALRDAALAGSVALAVLLPWLARNLAVYGDPLAIAVGSIPLERLTQLVPPEVARAAMAPDPEKTLLQLFGRFGVANNLSWSGVPALWLPLAVVGVAGWLRPARRASHISPVRWGAACAAALLCATAGLVAFGLRFYGGWQGRYLYVAALPLALLLAEGLLRGFDARRGARAVFALGAALVVLDGALLWKLDRYYARTPGTQWFERTRL